MPTENRSSNNEQTVSAPMSTLEKCLRDANLVRFTCDKHVLLLQDLLSQPAVQHQGEPVEWSSDKPVAPGAYWVRGNGLGRVALVEVAEEEGELRCNLHDRTTSDDFGYGYSIEQLSEEFEWCGPLYLHPPTSDGFSAGDMADQGAKAFRDGQQAAIPEGFALVPKEMLLSKEVIGVINFHCGDTAEEEGGQFGRYTDGRLWVGNVTDDDGNQVHGLHIMTDEYPEEGSTTLVEFPPPSNILPE